MHLGYNKKEDSSPHRKATKR